MKVNIRYTVDLEEVLGEMSNLYYKSLDRLETKLDIYDHFLNEGFSEADLEHIIQALEQNIQFYHDHQTKISEILSILRGYKSIREGNVEQQQPQRQPAPQPQVSDDV